MLHRITPRQTLADLKIAEQIVCSGKHVVIGSHPSSRASDAIVAALRAEGMPFVYLASVKPLADEMGVRHRVTVYHADADGYGGDEVVTIPFHLERFAYQGKTLVWDGAAWMTTDYSFRSDQVEQSIAHFNGEGFEQVIVLEDGPLRDKDPLRVRNSKFERIDIAHESPAEPIKWLSYKNMEAAIIDSVMAEPDRPHLISLFSKKNLKPNVSSLLKDVSEALEEAGAEVTVFNADEGSRTEAIRVLENEATTGATRVVITTYRAGFSCDSDPVVHIVPLVGAQHSPHDMQQIIHGVGMPDIRTDARLYWNFPPSHFEETDLVRYEEQQKQAALERIQQYKLLFRDPSDDAAKETIKILEQSDMGGTRQSDHQGLVFPNLRVNTFQIRHNVHLRAIQNAYSSPESFREALQGYGLDLIRGTSHERVVEALKVKTKISDEDFRKEVEEFFSEGISFSPEVGERCRFLVLHFDIEHAKDLMLKKGRVGSTWSPFQAKVLAKRPLTEAETKVRDDIYASFSIGDELRAWEIQNKIVDIMKDNPLITSTSITKTKATQTLNRYFDTKRLRRRIPAKTVGDGEPALEWVYKIQSDETLPYPLKPYRQKP